VATRPKTRDPRYRPYRVFFYGVYLLVVVVFSGNVILNVVRSVAEMTPPKRESMEATLSVKECLEAAEELWRELDSHRQGLSAHTPTRKVDQEWTEFRGRWLAKFREDESKCALRSRARLPLKTVYDRLDHLHDLYTTHAVQFAGEVGPAVDGFREAIQTAKQELAVGRLM
jgi:hypothetical protein